MLFKNCFKLTSLIIPASVTHIEASSCYGSSLTLDTITFNKKSNDYVWCSVYGRYTESGNGSSGYLEYTKNPTSEVIYDVLFEIHYYMPGDSSGYVGLEQMLESEVPT